MRNNRLRSGERDFHIELPADVLGTVGCRLLPITIEPEIGPEVCLLFTDDPSFASAYGSVRPLNLVAHSGAVRTSNGPVAFLVWQIAAGSSCECFMEQFINPLSPRMTGLVQDASKQSHLKLIIADNRSSEVSVLIDFENSFKLDEFAEMLAGINVPSGTDDFSLAVSEAMANYDVAALCAGR